MKDVTTWILVADAGRARLLERVEGDDELRDLSDRIHAESRLPAREFVSDRPGRTRQSVGTAGSAMGAKTSPHDVEVKAFAHELANILEAGVAGRHCDALEIVAPPKFLGLLRRELSGPVARLIRRTIDHDYTQLPMAELARRLAPDPD